MVVQRTQGQGAGAGESPSGGASPESSSKLTRVSSFFRRSTLSLPKKEPTLSRTPSADSLDSRSSASSLALSPEPGSGPVPERINTFSPSILGKLEGGSLDKQKLYFRLREEGGVVYLAPEVASKNERRILEKGATGEVFQKIFAKEEDLKVYNQKLFEGLKQVFGQINSFDQLKNFQSILNNLAPGWKDDSEFQDLQERVTNQFEVLLSKSAGEIVELVKKDGIPLDLQLEIRGKLQEMENIAKFQKRPDHPLLKEARQVVVSKFSENYSLVEKALAAPATNVPPAVYSWKGKDYEIPWQAVQDFCRNIPLSFNGKPLEIRPISSTEKLGSITNKDQTNEWTFEEATEKRFHAICRNWIELAGDKAPEFMKVVNQTLINELNRLTSDQFSSSGFSRQFKNMDISLDERGFIQVKIEMTDTLRNTDEFGQPNIFEAPKGFGKTTIYLTFDPSKEGDVQKMLVSEAVVREGFVKTEEILTRTEISRLNEALPNASGKDAQAQILSDLTGRAEAELTKKADALNYYENSKEYALNVMKSGNEAINGLLAKGTSLDRGQLIVQLQRVKEAAIAIGEPNHPIVKEIAEKIRPHLVSDPGWTLMGFDDLV